mgnify:CR=1 FL=1
MDGWECCLIDLDGDGQEELFLTDGGWRGVLTIKGGKVKILECGADVTICEGNYIAHTQRYLDGYQLLQSAERKRRISGLSAI